MILTAEVTPPIFDSTVLNSIVLGVNAILLGAIGIIAKMLENNKRATIAIKRDVKATRHEVQNDHESNLRDNIDQNHKEIKGFIRDQILDVKGQLADVHDRLNSHVDRFNNIDRRLNNWREHE